MFWTLIVLIGCLVYMHSTQRSMERQAKMEAENGRRQEQTYQAMVQHYRQVVLEQQARMDSPGHRSGSGSASGGVEAVQLLVESNMQRSARLEARVETLAKELDQLRRTLAECEGTSSTLFSSVSDLHHKMNNLNHSVMSLVDAA